MTKDNKISLSVIRRLPRYYRFLGELKHQDVERISSKGLSELMGLTASQIRQDLNCFGGFGQQGYGYNVDALYKEIGKILCVDKSRSAILLGAGNLGTALARQLDFTKRGCKLVGIFDNNKELFGNEIAGIKVSDISTIFDFCEKENPIIAILCIPKEAAQELADILVSAGIRAFWNFSHYDLCLEYRTNVVVENVHLGDSLLTLAYRVNNEVLDIENKLKGEAL